MILAYLCRIKDENIREYLLKIVNSSFKWQFFFYYLWKIDT